MSVTAKTLYDVVRKYYGAIPPLIFPVTFFVDAPFGRLTQGDSIFSVDGIKSWMVMELVSPLTFIYTFLEAPLSNSPSLPSLFHPSTFLAGLFLIHYTNRAVLSPLRTPSRSRSHIIVPLSGIIFNLTNGFLLGAYLSSPVSLRGNIDAYNQPTFWIGIFMWAVGFTGNIIHDEILLDIRRDKQKKEKAASGMKERYAIPRGYLYKYLSYPNYFCEWIEWAGFAIASSPTWFTSPPWLFLLAEICTMAPRAWKGHQWYKKNSIIILQREGQLFRLYFNGLFQQSI